MLQYQKPTIEIDANVLKNYPSLNADINIDETGKYIKQEEVFHRMINQLPPDNDIVYIDHDKKNNKFRVTMEMPDKNTTQKSREKLKRKAQSVIHTPGKRKPKRKPKNSQKKSS